MSLLRFDSPVEGRSYDALVFHDSAPFGNPLVEMRLGSTDGGEATTGIQKLTQRVLLRLFTSSLGQPYELTEGCSLLDAVDAQRIKNAADARGEFAAAREQVIDQFINDAIVRSNTPADERLQNLELLSAAVQGDVLYLVIRVTSQAGNQSQFIAPITLP